jgi:amidophosphoribosyltransferase
MAVFDGKKINLHRDLGLVSDVFKKNDLLKLPGSLGVAHVRYPTIGAGGPQDTQPFLSNSRLGEIALAHNGNIANYGHIRSELEGAGFKFCSTCDAELILAEFVKNINGGRDIFGACATLMENLDGSYSACAITKNGDFIIFRDPHAIRPLCWGQNGDVIMFASESVALDINSITLKGDVLAGECIIISKSGKITRKIVAKKTSNRHCAFEFVYFSRPDSIEAQRLIYEARLEMGKRLAKSAPADADIVVPVPDTSRPAAQGYSQESKIPLEEGLMKNRYIGRTFIMPSQKERLDAVKLKLNVLRTLVDGKKIVLIDDSIVRGTTAGPIVKLLKDAGAKKVHLRIACPPVISPCFYGVDLPTFDELAAANKSIDEIRNVERTKLIDKILN